MPRKSRDTDLSTPTARRRLKVKSNRTPYYRSVALGQFLGYRRSKNGPGTWTARFYLGSGQYEETPLGTADDDAPADGSKILDYSQAVRAALAFEGGRAKAAKAGSKPSPEPAAYTIDQAMAAYLHWYKAHRKPTGYQSARVMVSGSILPKWSGKPVNELTTAAIRAWHQDLASAPARLRPGRGGQQKTRQLDPGDIDAFRKRKATANRILTVFRAALNLAAAEECVPAEFTLRWRSVKPFRGVDKPKLRFFDSEEIARLLNQCEPDFRQIVTAALLTGARWSELTEIEFSDFSTQSRSLRVSGKTDGRLIYLNDEGLSFFSALAAGRPPHAPMLVRADGEKWARSHQTRRMTEAVNAANIPPPNSFHILRHTYASHYLMNGGTLEGLAKQLGHTDTRMTIRTYAHLAGSWRKAEAAAYAPSFGISPPTNIAPLQRLQQA